MGVPANSRTVWFIISSGSEVMSVERMNHCLPAAKENQPPSELVWASGSGGDTDVSPSKLGQRYPADSKTSSRLPHSTNNSRHPSWRSLANTPAPFPLARCNTSVSRPGNLDQQAQQ